MKEYAKKLVVALRSGKETRILYNTPQPQSTNSDTCGHLVWEESYGWWPLSHACTKKPNHAGLHIAEFYSFGGLRHYAIEVKGEKYAQVYVDTNHSKQLAKQIKKEMIND